MVQQKFQNQRNRSGLRTLAYLAIAVAGALAIGSTCTAVLRNQARGPQDLFVTVEDKTPDVDGALYSPQQVRVDIGARCIVGHARDGTQLLLLFDAGRVFVESAGEQRITQVYRPDPASWRQLEAGLSDADGDVIGTRYITPDGMTISRDADGFWVDEQGHDPLVEDLVSVGDVVSGEVMLVSTRPFASHHLKWITTPYPECEALPHAFVPMSYPS